MRIYSKPVGARSHWDKLASRREPLGPLESEAGRIADLKRILAARIAEMESKTG